MEPKISTSTKIMSGCLVLLPVCRLGSLFEIGVNWLNIAGFLYTAGLAWASIRFLKTGENFYKTLENIGFQAYLAVGSLLWMTSSGFNWFLAVFSLLATLQAIFSVASLAQVAENAKMP